MSSYGLTKENLLAALPAALRQDETLLALADLTAEILAGRPEEIDQARIYPQIDALEEKLLDILASDFKVDWWDADLSLDAKRQTLEDNWRVHKILGTPAAVSLVIAAIYGSGTIKEWFAYDGAPHHFKVYIRESDALFASDTTYTDFLRRLNTVKRLSSQFDGLVIETDLYLYTGFAERVLEDWGELECVEAPLDDPLAWLMDEDGSALMDEASIIMIDEEA